MTDASGQYSFAGLAAGDYTVSIAVESAAYVFESMSSDVTVDDDESAIVNFEGAHARTASVSGMVFIDEATRNDMFDEGENALAHAGIPVVLVGPGVNQQQLGTTNADGQFSFSGLRAGPYQLVVTISAEVAAALAVEDLAYGGPGEGYAIALGVGEAATQSIPFDITHTTVNFSVSLRSGDDEGVALPGASVTLYADAAGETKVGGGETGDDGSVAIKVARAGTSGNTVHAGVAADGYHVADGETAVSWDPQMFATAGANENDIVNLNVDATVSGATVTTEYGGGKALAGWAMSVMSGEDAVDGAPEKLDDDGNASLKTSVAADDLPATFAFAVAADQANTLDGGEAYKGKAVEYTHTGLSLAGTADAGTMEVAYATQTLKVYVHHEKDQVEGYTGNILGGDARVSGMVDIGIRYIDDNGRSRSFTRAQWNPATQGNYSDRNGVVTFAHVPADANVVVQADEAVEGIKLLDPDELAAYTGMEANGVAGGAFGANGGFHHTVELCPLQATEPAGQDHGECASFAFVTMHTVSGLVWKRGVTMDPASDGFKVGAGNGDPTFVPGITVTVSPVEGKNLAGDEASHTTTEEPVRTPGENAAGTSILDETHQFRFGRMAAGVYEVSVPSGWRYRIGGKGSEARDNGELSPLADHVSLDVTPSTATLYGRLTGRDGFALDSVTVIANNVATRTDAHGRYILEGIVPQTRRLDNVTYSNKIFLQAGNAAGFNNSRIRILNFAANAPSEQDIDLSGVQARATISGTARASGTYTAIIAAKDLGATAVVSASKAGMTFIPPSLAAPAHAGAEISGIDFTGFVNATISGRVVAPAGGPMRGVTVTATSTVPGTTAAAATVTTGVTGTFRLNVPFGSYTIAASAANHVFGYPATGQVVNVAPGQSVNFGAIQAKTAMARSVTAGRLTETTDDVTTYTGTVQVGWTANAEDVPNGYNDATYTIQTNTGAGGTWEDQSGATVVADSSLARFDNAPDGAFMVRVVATATPTGAGSDLVLRSTSVASVGAVDPSASGVSAARSGNDIEVGWSAVTNSGSNQRVVIQVAPAALNGTSVWFVAGNGTPDPIESGTRAWSLTVADDFSETWTAVGGADVTITAADLNKAVNVAVESAQGTVSDTNPWKRSAVRAVGAKP